MTAPTTNVTNATIDYRGRRVLVTGAAGGLGLVFARAFAAAGADVALADIAEPAVRHAAEGLAEQHPGQRITGLAVDVTDEAATKAAAAQVAQALGGIDVLVNNAAIYAGLTRGAFHELPVAEWDRVMAVNLKGPFLMARAAFPWLRQADAARGGGAIVNLASATVMSGSPGWPHYVASKGGVIALTRALAREIGDANVRVNAVAPGLTLTEASLGLLDDAATYGVNRGALKRASQPEDIVGAVLYLASPLAAFITGQTLVVDGGRQFI